jgi:NADH-quinone oxidoreductase subunit E
MFFLEPVGEHVVEVCTNVSCCLVGATDVVAAFEQELGCRLGQTSPDGVATLRSVECLGGCGWGPVVSVDHRYLEHFTADDARTVVADLRSREGGHH